jgi:hypothetical protein
LPSAVASKLTLFFLVEERTELGGSGAWDEGELWGVFSSTLAPLSLGAGCFIPKGSSRKSRTAWASWSVSWASLGGVGGRRERAWNWEEEDNTMAMQKNDYAKARRARGLTAGIGQTSRFGGGVLSGLPWLAGWLMGCARPCTFTSRPRNPAAARRRRAGGRHVRPSLIDCHLRSSRPCNCMSTQRRGAQQQQQQ